MSNTAATRPETPVLGGAEPVIYVTDFSAALAFYVEKLGFAVDFTYGEPPFFGVVARDAARLCLRKVAGPVFAGDVRQREELLSAAITLENAAAIQQLFLDYQAAGLSFQLTLRTQPWGARNFIVLDPDGNLILFASPAE